MVYYYEYIVYYYYYIIIIGIIILLLLLLLLLLLDYSIVARTCSSTQSVISPPSGESAAYGIVKGASLLLGAKGIAAYYGGALLL